MIHVIFDFDEVIGHFYELSALFHDITSQRRLSKEERLDILETLVTTYPTSNCIRPGIVDLLRTLAQLRNLGYCRLGVYTNNNGGRTWVDHMTSVLDRIVGDVIFDNIVYEYDASRLRTTSEKTYPDLLRCINADACDHIVFIDDLIHPKMVTQGVTYIHVSKYEYTIPPAILQMIHQINGIPYRPEYRPRGNISPSKYQSHGEALKSLVLNEIYRYHCPRFLRNSRGLGTGGVGTNPARSRSGKHI